MRMEEPSIYPSRGDLATGRVVSIVDYFIMLAKRVHTGHPFYSAFHSPYELSWEYGRRLLINELAGGLLEWRAMDDSERGEWDAVITLRNMQRLIDQYLEHEERELERKQQEQERKRKK